MKHWNNSVLPDKHLFPDNYQLREIIHESVNSTLFLAFDTHTNSDVVIKCFKTEAKGAYLREISAAFDIQHPNLVRCLNTFHRSDGIACIVYEYLAGGSLAALLEAKKTLPLISIIACLQAMLKVLCYLNSTNRIHCDIKPENILLRPRIGKQADYVLIDLGAACFLPEAQSGKHVTGTPAYIAPERIKNKFFFNSDLYSLGVIAFELSTGKRPFTGTVDELTQANLSEIPSLSAIKPAGLRDFIDYLLVKNPEKRLSSAELALTLLNKVLNQTDQIPKRPLRVRASDYSQLVLPIDSHPKALHCFKVNNCPLIAVVYEYYIDILDPLKPKYPFKTLLTNQPIQVINSDLFAYATPSRIQLLNLNDSSELLIKEHLTDLKSWHIGQNKLIWNNAHHCFYESLSNDEQKKLTISNYLFSPEIAILSNDNFIISEGIANNKIVLRNTQTITVQEWQLQEPIIALSHINNTLLVVTRNLNKNSSYDLWVLAENQPPRHLLLPDDISQISCINGIAFWLSDNRVLSYCDTTLQPKVLHTFSLNVCKFAVCYNHHYIAIDYKDTDNKLFLTILKNRAIS